MPTHDAHATVRSKRRKGRPAVAAPPAVTPSSPTVPRTAAAHLEQELVARAITKLVGKQQLTASEREALKRHEKGKEERLRLEYYATIPQRHWRLMSGRQSKVLNEQAQRYGLPFGGPTINLNNLARALHDFLADNAVKLARDNDALLSGPASPALERYREERAALARLDRLERQGRLMPRRDVRLGMGLIAGMLRSGLEALERQFGRDAAEIVLEAIEDAEAEIARRFGALPDAESLEDAYEALPHELSNGAADDVPIEEEPSPDDADSDDPPPLLPPPALCDLPLPDEP